MVISDGANVHVVPMDKVDYVEAQDDYVSVESATRACSRSSRWPSWSVSSIRSASFASTGRT